MPAPSGALALMRLTPRDRALLVVLRELRYLTAAQIRLLCYPSIVARSMTCQLSKLGRRGVLTFLRNSSFADRRAFWTLSPLGRAAAEALAGNDGASAGPESSERPAALAVAVLQIDHLIATNQLFCDLCLEHRAGRAPALRWLGSRHARIDLGHTCLVPDAVITVPAPGLRREPERPGGWWMYLLERDRGTMALPAIADKLSRYSAMRRIAGMHVPDPLWEARADAWILFACDDVRRAADIMSLAVTLGLERVWAGPADTCARDLASGLLAAADTRGRSVAACAAPPVPGTPGGLALPVGLGDTRSQTAQRSCGDGSKEGER